MGATTGFGSSVFRGCFAITLTTVLVLAATICGAGFVQAADIGGFVGVPKNFDLMMEADCRVCHDDETIVVPEYLPDRHHQLVGETIPPDTDAPAISDGETTYECLSCHELEWDPNLMYFKFNSFRDCMLCHMQKPGQEGTVHHRSPEAQTGDCTYCHTTPAFANDRPTQAACRECHGAGMHDNGEPILDFGACVSCHNDSIGKVSAPIPATSSLFPTYGVPIPFHSKPPRPPGYLIIPSGQVSPGGPVYESGKGKFALFWALFTNNGDEEIVEDVRPNGEDLNDEGGFRWSKPTLDFNLVRIVNNGRSYDVPAFPALLVGVPAITIETPKDGDDVSGDVVINVRASDDQAVMKVVYWVDQGSQITMDGPDGSQSGTWTATWDSHYIQPFVSLDGPHTINVQVEDYQGMTSTSSLTVSVKNDSGGDSADGGNLALNKSASASDDEGSSYRAYKAIDGSTLSYWRTDSGDDEWLKVDLGQNYRVDKVVIKWGNEFAEEYEVAVSTNGYSWTRVKDESSSNGGTDTVTFSERDVRYVRVLCTREDNRGYRITELEVYNDPTSSSSTSSTSSDWSSRSGRSSWSRRD